MNASLVSGSPPSSATNSSSSSSSSSGSSSGGPEAWKQAAYADGFLVPFVAQEGTAEIPRDLSMKIIKARQEFMTGTHLRVQALLEQAAAEIEATSTDDLQEFYQQELSLSGIKGAMRFDALDQIKIDAKQKSHMQPTQEAVLATAKACELFILELAYRAWASKELTQDSSTISKDDILAAVSGSEHFDIFTSVVTSNVDEGASPKRGKRRAGGGIGTNKRFRR